MMIIEVHPLEAIQLLRDLLDLLLLAWLLDLDALGILKLCQKESRIDVDDVPHLIYS